GDVGALSIGGSLGMMAVLTKNEIVLLIVGGLFVIETLSVIIQRGAFKITKPEERREIAGGGAPDGLAGGGGAPPRGIDLSGKTVVVVGLALTGVAVA